MPGFCGVCGDLPSKLVWPISVGKELSPTIKKTAEFDEHYIHQYIIPKFVDEKLFFNTDNIFVCMDGTILNAKDLCSEFNAEKYEDLIEKMYKECGAGFVSRLRGDFSGIVYNKSEKKVHIFTNQIGSKTLYYFIDKDNKILIYGSGLQAVVNIMRECGYKAELSELSAYFLLTFGYMLRENTLCSTVKKILPGTILTFDIKSGATSLDKYYELKSTPYVDDTKENILREMDRRFEEAIKKEYGKDLEYGYRHIATLSGGLDSRTNVTKAHMLGYEDIFAITFSQSDYLDERIAKQIASDLGFGFLFFALDNGNYLKEMELPIIANDGQVLFSGAAHMLAMLKLLNWEPFGLLHTGQIGDLVLGSYLLGQEHHRVSEKAVKKVAYSTKLIDRIPSTVFEELSRVYETDEIFAFYERCVNGVFNGYQVIQNYSEFASPFLYLDFLDYVMRIHPKHRFGNVLYREWIEGYIPIASKYPWEKTGVKINASLIRKIVARGIKIIRRDLFRDKTQISMNPFDYWYDSNPELREIFETYLKDHIHLLNKHPVLKEDTVLLFDEGNALEKTQALTLLAAVDLLQLDK
ncbi:MAG: hypothetical protein PWQ62_267 [Candidatus Methanomethylophilaceae archaeon]|nr:hypothetical protein [Candidatus Methanomethylophilaceae archaeon]